MTFTTAPPELIAPAAEVPDEPAKAAAADVAAAADEAAPADLLQRHPRMSFTPAQLQAQEMAEREAFPMGWGQLSPEAQAAEMERIKAMPVPDDGECEDDTEDSEAAAAGVEAAGGPSKPGDDRAGPPEDHEPTHEPDGEPEVAPPPPPGRPPANRPAVPHPGPPGYHEAYVASAAAGVLPPKAPAFSLPRKAPPAAPALPRKAPPAPPVISRAPPAPPIISKVPHLKAAPAPPVISRAPPPRPRR